MVREIMSGNVTRQAIASDPNIRHYLGDVEISEKPVTTEFVVGGSLPTHYTLSPLFAPDELLAKIPNCIIYVSEHDVLYDDGVLLHKRSHFKVYLCLQLLLLLDLSSWASNPSWSSGLVQSTPK